MTTDSLDFDTNIIFLPFEFELPVDVFNYQNLRLYEPKPISRINPPDKDSKLDKEGGILPLFKERGYGFGGGKKLRSAKKTSKRRSVKSKPRHYRRSVGGINHRRKKTTRRRQ